MPSHTLGPWRIEGQFDAEVEVEILNSFGFTICEIGPALEDWEPDEIANAHLIAAAPELLESLQTMTAFAHAYVGDDPKGLALVAKATAVIFKAQGQLQTSPGRAEQSPTKPQEPTEAKA